MVASKKEGIVVVNLWLLSGRVWDVVIHNYGSLKGSLPKHKEFHRRSLEERCQQCMLVNPPFLYLYHCPDSSVLIPYGISRSCELGTNNTAR